MADTVERCLVVLVAALTGCTDARPPHTAAASSPKASSLPEARGSTRGDVGSRGDAGSDARSAARPSRYFATSPMTELADAVTEVALAALREEPLPDRLPIALVRPGQRIVEAKDGTPAGDSLEVVAFAAWVKMVLRQAQPGALMERNNQEPRTEAEQGSIQALLWLDRSRLRLAGIKMGAPDDVGATPAWLIGLHDSAGALHRAARGGALRSWLVDESSRAAYGNELSAQLGKARPTDALVARVEAAAREWPLWGISDVSFIVLVRTPNDGVWQLALDTDYDSIGIDGGNTGTTQLLRSFPLVRVSRVHADG